MSDPERGEIDKYERFRSMPIEEVRTYLDSIGQSFEDVKKHYTGPLGRFRKNIRDEDMSTLTGHIGDLLPMGMSEAVQAEIRGYNHEDPLGLTFNRIGQLSSDIMVFAAKFENSGITVYEGGGFLD